MTRRSSFGHVIFDLDGTLVATDGFWIPAARAGAARAFAELALDRAQPSSEEWMSLVGLPLSVGIAQILPDLDEPQRAHVLERCVEAEHELLRSGGAILLPGVAETLAELHAQGVRMGVASNCGRDYLDHMLGQLAPLREFISEGRCLDSPGVTDKADMVADLLLTFGTREAVMVGDRGGDREAAWANGLPFVHCAFGFGSQSEAEQAEAVIEEAPELLDVLARRDEWIRAELEKLGAFGSDPPRTIRVAGARGAGTTSWARSAARLLGGLEWSEDEGCVRIELGGSGPEPTVFLRASRTVRARRLAGRDRIPGVTNLGAGAACPECPGPPPGATVLDAENALGAPTG